MKTIHILLFVKLTVVSIAANASTVNFKTPGVYSNDSLLQKPFELVIDSLIPKANHFVKQHGFNDDIIFIADLSIHSGLPRFAIVSLKQKKILCKGMVAHGCGNFGYSEKAAFSNLPNSNCSSPGKYKIGAKYNGNFGKAYKLYGLESSNSNAYRRNIVLHGYECVTGNITYPQYLCNSRGCPMVSYSFLKILEHYIDAAKKPLLLWIVK